jgi:competence protein ComEA
MASRGAQGTDEELDQITEYLAKNFGPNSPAPATSTASGKVSINTASAADLVSALDISKADADAIVAYRTAHGPFHVIQDLKQVPGIDAKKIEAAQSKIDFHS